MANNDAENADSAESEIMAGLPRIEPFYSLHVELTKLFPELIDAFEDVLYELRDRLFEAPELIFMPIVDWAFTEYLINTAQPNLGNRLSGFASWFREWRMTSTSQVNLWDAFLKAICMFGISDKRIYPLLHCLINRQELEESREFIEGNVGAEAYQVFRKSFSESTT